MDGMESDPTLYADRGCGVRSIQIALANVEPRKVLALEEVAKRGEEMGVFNQDGMEMPGIVSLVKELDSEKQYEVFEVDKMGRNKGTIRQVIDRGGVLFVGLWEFDKEEKDFAVEHISVVLGYENYGEGGMKLLIADPSWRGSQNWKNFGLYTVEYEMFKKTWVWSKGNLLRSQDKQYVLSASGWEIKPMVALVPKANQ